MLLAAFLVLTGLALVSPSAPSVGAGATQPAAGKRGWGRLYPPEVTPMAGVPFTLKAELTSLVKRPMVIQRLNAAGKYENLVKDKSSKRRWQEISGVVLTERSTLRLVAPRCKCKLNHAKPRVVTKPVVVDPVVQSGSIAVLPGVVQQGPAPTDPTNETFVVVGFAPARIGRPVQLQQLVNGSWQGVQNGTQDGAGFASFSVQPGTYRGVTSASGNAPEVVTGQVDTRTWQLAFEDTFSGASLNTAMWTSRVGDTNTGGARTCASQDLSRTWVANGALELGIGLDPSRAGEVCHYTAPRTGPGTSPYLINTQLQTEHTYSFTHGIAAARVKFQQPKGMHGCFWLLPSGGKIPGRPELGAEVDVVEYFGAGGWLDGVGGFIHYLNESGRNVKLGDIFGETGLMKPPGDEWWSSYHVFSVEWTPREYIFRVDGREFYREDRAVSQRSEYLVLSLLTSDYELPNLTPEKLNATMSVDWVRVWQ